MAGASNVELIEWEEPYWSPSKTGRVIDTLTTAGIGEAASVFRSLDPDGMAAALTELYGTSTATLITARALLRACGEVLGSGRFPEVSQEIGACLRAAGATELAADFDSDSEYARGVPDHFESFRNRVAGCVQEVLVTVVEPLTAQRLRRTLAASFDAAGL